MPTSRRRSVALALAALCAGAVLAVMHAPGVTLAAQARIDFQRDVRPILSDNCFLCHGPDQSTRKANLRLDLHQDTLTARRNGTPVVAGKPDQSLIYKKIIESDPARRMPPLSTHKTLTDAQIATIGRWIEQGAEWKEHWAFVAPRAPGAAASERSEVAAESDRSVRARED